MGIHRTHHTLHQRVVITLHLDILYTFFLLDSSTELPAQAAHIVYEVVYLDMKLFHAERLGDIRVSPRFQPLKFVFHLRLRSQHDHRDLRNLRIILDPFQESETIHLRHHHIAHHQVVVLRQQHLQTLFAVGGMIKLIAAAKFVNDIVSYLLVIIYHKYLELAEAAFVTIAVREHLTGRAVSNDLIRFQMTVALRQRHREAGPLAVAAIVRLDLAAMKLGDGQTQVQPDTSPLHTEVIRVTALIETGEKTLLVFFFNTGAVVHNLYFDVFLLFTQHYFHLTPVKGVLEGIRQEIRHHLVKMNPIDPCQHMVLIMLERERNVPLVRVILIQLTDSADKVHHVRLPAVQLHLVFVYTPFVQYLVHQQHQSLRIPVNRLNRRLYSPVIQSLNLCLIF